MAALWSQLRKRRQESSRVGTRGGGGRVGGPRWEGLLGWNWCSVELDCSGDAQVCPVVLVQVPLLRAQLFRHTSTCPASLRALSTARTSACTTDEPCPACQARRSSPCRSRSGDEQGRPNVGEDVRGRVGHSLAGADGQLLCSGLPCLALPFASRCSQGMPMTLCVDAVAWPAQKMACYASRRGLRVSCAVFRVVL